MSRPDEPPRLSPLSHDTLCVLLVLAHGEAHGYAIIQEAAKRSNGAVELQTGALYRTLKRLLAGRLIEEAGRQHVPGSAFERRRYYRITKLGITVVAAEADRLNRLALAARHALSGRRPRLA